MKFYDDAIAKICVNLFMKIFQLVAEMRQTVSKLKVEQIKTFKIHKKKCCQNQNVQQYFKTQMSKFENTGDSERAGAEHQVQQVEHEGGHQQLDRPGKQVSL